MTISVSSVLYVIEILFTEFLFIHSFEKRDRFFLRVSVAVAVCIVCAAFFPSDVFNPYTLEAVLLNLARYFLLFSLTVISLYFCYNAKFWTVLSACTGGYAMQHMIQRIFVILGLFITPFEDIGYPWNVVYRELICLLPIVPLYFIFFFTLGKDISEKYYKNENDHAINLLSISVMIICMIVSRIQDFEEMSKITTLSVSTYAIICCAVVLFLKSSVLAERRNMHELELTRQLYAKEQEQYRLWQSSLDVINIKCHDLKYRIAGLKSHISEESIKDIEESVMIYDSALKTGNEVLDVILFEKNVFCEKNGIQFIYMADGAALNFIEKSELFTFFMNMLNNAIEAVMHIEQEKRVIQLSVKRVGDMVFINEENYYDGDIVLENGFPITKKENRGEHGFGLKGMQRFTDKYGGTMSFSANGEVFSLKICIPFKT